MMGGEKGGGREGMWWGREGDVGRGGEVQEGGDVGRKGGEGEGEGGGKGRRCGEGMRGGTCEEGNAGGNKCPVEDRPEGKEGREGRVGGWDGDGYEGMLLRGRRGRGHSIKASGA